MVSESAVQQRCESIIAASVKPPDTMMWRFYWAQAANRAKWHREMLAREELEVAAYTRLLIAHDPAWRNVQEEPTADE